MQRNDNAYKRIMGLGICVILTLGMIACKTVEKEPVKTQAPTTVAETKEDITEGVDQESFAQETSTVEMDTVEASGTEEMVTEMVVTEVSSEEVVTTEEIITEPVATEPVTAEPATTEPITTEPATTEASTTEAPVPQSIHANVKGNHYIGDVLSASDFTITITMSDGSTRKNPAGWSADKLYLEHSVNEITVTYQGLSTTVIVNAAERPVETQAPVPEESSTEESVKESSSQQPTQDQGSSNDGMELRRSAAEEAFRIQNDLIVQNGGTPLQWSETYYQQACQRAKEIVTNFSHDGFYNTTAYAENIAMGSYDANVMVQAWYNSDGHRNNMLHGWGYGAIACYGDHWVALFGPTPG